MQEDLAAALAEKGQLATSPCGTFQAWVAYHHVLAICFVVLVFRGRVPFAGDSFQCIHRLGWRRAVI